MGELAAKKAEAEAKAMAMAMAGATSPKKKDAPTMQNAKVEDPHGKTPAGRKSMTAPKKPSTVMMMTRRRKKDVGGSLPLLLQKAPGLAKMMDDPSLVESLLNHLSTWKPFESLATMKAPDVTQTTAAVESATTESEERIDDEPPG